MHFVSSQHSANFSYLTVARSSNGIRQTDDDHFQHPIVRAPIDLQFDDFNVVHSDIVVVMNSNRIVTPTKIKGVPELVVEMLSPSTRERDQQLKRELYEQNRVPEYWTVDADNQLLSCYRLSSEGAYAQPTQHSDEVSIALGNVTARIDLRKVW